MGDSTLDMIMARWDGPRWRWWTFAAGLLSVPVAAVLALTISYLAGQRFVPLAMLILLAIILGGSLVGAGFIETLTSQMTRGGLARDSTELVEATELEGDEKAESDQERRDRRTIRAGLFILGPVMAFVYFLAIV